MKSYEPFYIETFNKGLIKKKRDQAFEMMASCNLCPRKCNVNRLSNETGVCKTGRNALVSNFNPHFGEEPPLVGQNGSGTIFFAGCNLKCNFCQNYDISHFGHGEKTTDLQLSKMMLMLQLAGCHNINFVTPSHVIPQILSALEIAIPEGLKVPIVYNTSAYDRVETIKLLEGIFDIYMPDFKFWDQKVAQMTCKAPDYPEIARKAIIEMHRQVGNFTINTTGTATRGLLIRHLVLPEGLAGTKKIMNFIAQKISIDTYVNIMPQYRPCGKAHEIDKLSRRLSMNDYKTALLEAEEEKIKIV